MVIPVGSRNSRGTLVMSSMMFSSFGEGPGEPMEFGDDQGVAGPDSRQGFVQSRPFLVPVGQPLST